LTDRERIAQLEKALAVARQDRIHWQQLAIGRARLLETRADEIKQRRTR
jgi:hypothetical protein